MATVETTLTARALQLLEREDRPMHTWEIALLLQVQTKDVHLAMHEPHQRAQVRFTSTHGWDLTPKMKLLTPEGQARLEP
jgi:hypothetical protein